MFWFGKNQTHIKGKRILVISDIHFPLTEREMRVLAQDFDECWVLGDVPRDILFKLENKPYPVLGVLGNHDTHESFEGLSILNVNGVAVEQNGVTIAGIEGSSKYKNSPYVMLSQYDSEQLAKKTPAADVLLSHDSGRYEHSEEVHKEGLQGITEYIAKHHPLLHIYGHHHEHREYKRGKTLCICNYRLGIIEKTGLYYTQAE